MEQAEFNRYGGTLLSPVMGIMNPLKPPFKGTPATISKMLQEATQTINANPAAGEVAVYVRQKYNPNSVPSTEGNRVAEAIGTCEAVKTVNCAAFRDPNFARNCVMAHEPATNSKGDKQLGGIVLFREDRISQAQAARAAGRAPAYTATIGQLPLSGVSVDEESCNAMMETVACQRQKNFSTPNCASCQDGQGNWQRVGPKAVREPAKLVLIGSGAYTFTGTNLKEVKGTLSGSPSEIELPAAAEGLTFTLKVTGDQVKVGGYLEGVTPNGTTKTDLTFLATYDIEGGAKPRIIGYEMLGPEPVNTIRPMQGKTGVTLQIYMPFTFLAATEEAANLCPTAPYSTKEESVKLLASDPCYGKGPPPLECLQGRFVAAGCSSAGKGYPGTEVAAQALRSFNGQTQSLGQISQRIANAATSSQTGRAVDGSKLSVESWNEVSQFCLGKSVTSPCTAYDNGNGPLGDDCISYLYQGGSIIDKPGGAPNPIGKTYTLPTNQYGSMTASGMPAQCTKEGTAAPYSAATLDAARKLGGVSAVQKYYDGIHRRANDNGLSDEARKEAIRQCYGVQMAADTRQKMGEPLVKTEKVSFSSGQNTFMRHSDFILRNQQNDGGKLFAEDATFIQRTPLCGLPGFTSLEATNFPNYYVVAEGPGAALRPRERTANYEDRACWKLDQQSSGQVALQNATAPGKYLISRGSDVYLTVPGSTDNAAWTQTKPLK